MAQELRPVDPAAIPQLSGRFEPVATEISVNELNVEGSLPSDLTGSYVRNGPNPRFTPLGSYTYPLEGDAMVHGLRVENGRAHYANRWVRTRGMAAEERAGQSLYGGIMTPAFVDTALLGPEPDPGWPFRLDPFVNVVRHAGRYLALEEGTPPYEITGDLATLGLFDFDGQLPAGMCAHPKIDPVTGEMVLFRYDVEAPYLTWAIVGPEGTITQPATAVDGVDDGFMVHDFAITEHYLILTISPALFDLEAMVTGGSALQWKPELGTRIAVIPRDGSSGPKWDPYPCVLGVALRQCLRDVREPSRDDRFRGRSDRTRLSLVEQPRHGPEGVVGTRQRGPHPRHSRSGQRRHHL